MKWVISISYGELTLKGHNRYRFEDQAIMRVRRSLRDFNIENIYKEQGKFYIEANPDDFPEMIDKIKKVFGIVSISPAIRVEKTKEDMAKGAVELVCQGEEFSTFKVQARRSDKSFIMQSPEINAYLGGVVLDNFPQVTVDVHHPDKIIYVEVKEYIYLYFDRIPGYGGLPVGSSGRGLLLLSGGIDSPVAGYLMAGRGMELGAMHFHSYPFTPIRGEEKVKNLARILSGYCGPMTFYSINILPIQKEIRSKCKEREMTILSRRFMMRIGEQICKKYAYQGMITGESLGQVASQTIESMGVIDASTTLPILRPLVGMDKRQITEIAQEIETYDTSIVPFVDSCTVFLPKRPLTKPRLSDIIESEKNLDVEGLVHDAVENMKIVRIKPEV